MAGAITVYIDTIMHATEDHARILESFRDVLGLEPDAFDTAEVEGHFHNPIATATARLRKRGAREFLDRLRGGISSEQAADLSGTLPSRISGSTLYIRVGKQDLVSGRISLKDDDAVRVRITMPVYNGQTEAAFRDVLHLHH